MVFENFVVDLIGTYVAEVAVFGDGFLDTMPGKIRGDFAGSFVGRFGDVSQVVHARFH